MLNKSMFGGLAAGASSSYNHVPIEANKRYRARVINVKDPKKTGRVMIWIPDLMSNMAEDKTECWASPGNSPFMGNKDTNEIGGKDCGSLLVPPLGSEVWVIFEDGDFNRAIYLGGIGYETDEAVPVENQSGKEYYNKWTLLKSPKGRQIFVSDDPDDESIIIRGKQKKRSNRTKSSDPREPFDSAYIEIWDKEGEEYVIMKDSKGQHFLLDPVNERVRIQAKSGSFIELRGNDIVIQGKKLVLINCEVAYFEEHP